MIDLSKPITIDESWKQEDGKYECPICKKKYTRKGIATHIYRSHTDKKFSSGYNGHYDNEEYKQKQRESTDNKLGEYKDFLVICGTCNKNFYIREREYQFPKKETYYCNRKCANSVGGKLGGESLAKRLKNDKEFGDYFSKQATDNSLRLWQDPEYAKRVLNSNCKKLFTSKGELHIRSYFIDNYKEDEWTFGGAIKYEDSGGIVRDLYSNKLKVCLEYDGIWHFKDIKGQLKKKQKKDKALKDWCLYHGYRLIRLSETYFHKYKDTIFDILEDIIYNDDRQLVFLGDEYK